MNISIRRILFCILLLSLIPFCAFAQQQEPLHDQMRELLKSDPFNLSFLMQSTGDLSLQDDDFRGGSGFGLGATRLKFDGTLDGGYSYKLQTEFRRQPSVWDASIGYRKSDAFGLDAGLQKPDIGLDLQPNPGATDFIDRARLIGTMLNSREIGVAAAGAFDSFDYTVSVLNGTGRSLKNDDRFMVTVKGAFTVNVDPDGVLYIGANGALNGTEDEPVGDFGQISEGDRLIYGGYIDYESDQWFGTAELLMTTFESTQFQDDETITGAYVTLGNNVTDKDQILVRWDHIGYDQIDYTSDLFVFGWNHQATSVISMQVNALGQFDDGEEFFGFAGLLQFQF